MIVKIISILGVALVLVTLYSCLVVAGRADDEIERELRELEAMKGDKLE